MSFDVAALNAGFNADSDPLELIRKGLELAENPVLTTNFGPHEGVILHMCTQVKPDIPVVWMDSGYATAKTYHVAEELTQKLNLNLHVYNPQWSASRRNAVMDIHPQPGDESILDHPRYEEFKQQVKMEPFGRAMKEWAPDVWFTAIRAQQNEGRAEMEPASMELDGMLDGGVLRLAPVFHWTTKQMFEYLRDNQLPNVEWEEYFDPTKLRLDLECGLHVQK